MLENLFAVLGLAALAVLPFVLLGVVAHLVGADWPDTIADDRIL